MPQVKEYLANPDAFAVVAGPTTTEAKPAAETKEEETKEDEEESDGDIVSIDRYHENNTHARSCRALVGCLTKKY